MALGISRGAIVQDTPVGGPGKAPLRERATLWIARGSAVIPRFWIDAAVNPRAAGRAAIVLEYRIARYVWSVAQRIRLLAAIPCLYGRANVVAIDLF